MCRRVLFSVRSQRKSKTQATGGRSIARAPFARASRSLATSQGNSPSPSPAAADAAIFATDAPADGANKASVPFGGKPQMELERSGASPGQQCAFAIAAEGSNVDDDDSRKMPPPPPRAPAVAAATPPHCPPPAIPDELWSEKLPAVEDVRTYYNDGFIFSTETLNAVAMADDAADRTSPTLGRAMIGAIRATSQSAVAAHLTSGSLERAIAASEVRHTRGVQFLFDHLVNPVIEEVGGPVAAAVIKCCLPCVGPLPSFVNGTFDPAAFAVARAVQREHLVHVVGLDARDLDAAPELVDGPLLARIGVMSSATRAALAALPGVEQNYLSAYAAARFAATDVIAGAEAKYAAAATCPVAAAAAARRAAAAAAARNDDGGSGGGRGSEASLPDLLDATNDEFTRSFQAVGDHLIIKMAKSFGSVASVANARTDTLHGALAISLERHDAKAKRDEAMLRSLRGLLVHGRDGASGDSGSTVLSAAASAALAQVLAAYDEAVRAAELGKGAEPASTEKKRRAPTGFARPAAADAAAAAAAGAAASRPAAFNGQQVRTTINNNKKKRRNRNKKQRQSNNTGNNTAAAAAAAAAADGDINNCDDIKAEFNELENSICAEFASVFTFDSNETPASPSSRRRRVAGRKTPAFKARLIFSPQLVASQEQQTLETRRTAPPSSAPPSSSLPPSACASAHCGAAAPDSGACTRLAVLPVVCRTPMRRATASFSPKRIFKRMAGKNKGLAQRVRLMMGPPGPDRCVEERKSYSVLTTANTPTVGPTVAASAAAAREE